jgi:predicted amidohydrolase YtcJ
MTRKRTCLFTSLLLSLIVAASLTAQDADVILRHGRITTLDPKHPAASAVAIKDGKFLAVGSDALALRHKGASTRVIDLQGCRVIPGLNDSHMHVLREGLNYALELRWDGIRTLKEGLDALRDQAARTPKGQWVRVVGGWSEFQFAEKRMPTLQEINEAAAGVPVFVLHLYDRAWLNKAALDLVGYGKDTPNPPAGEIQRDAEGNPTGLLIARPNAFLLYDTLNKAPKLSPEEQMISTRHFMREMNRFGVTSAEDPGGGFQNFPEDYGIITQLADQGLVTLRIAYSLYPQKAKVELPYFQASAQKVKPGDGSAFLRMNGAGEMLVFTAADFEDFLQTRPELPGIMESEMEPVVRFFAENHWPFRLHATYNESISRALDVFEKVNREIPFKGFHWVLDHAETISDANVQRVKQLGGGISIQHRMAFQGEYFQERYGKEAAASAPPFVKMLKAGVPVAAGTDGTRVATYNPFVSLSWLVTGRTVGGTIIYPKAHRLDRITALKAWTQGGAWVTNEVGVKGAITKGQLADLAVLSDDYLKVPEAQIAGLESVLTLVDGKPVYSTGPFQGLAPELPELVPTWSPVNAFGGYGLPKAPRISDHESH